MILFENEYEWKREDSKTDVRFCFDCPEEAAELRVTFSFEPDALRDEEACAPMITEAIEKYYEGRERDGQKMTVSSMCPLKNLITLSLSREGKYVGNAHRWSGNQTHILTRRKASPGFSVSEQLSGQWEGMLHLHAVCTETCRGKLKVEGRTADEMVSG